MGWKKLFGIYRICIVLSLCIVICVSLVLVHKSGQDVTLTLSEAVERGKTWPSQDLLVNTSGCQLLNMDPFSPNVRPYLEISPRSVICPTPMVLWGSQSNSLIIDKDAMSYNRHNRPVTCCMKEVKRVNEDPNNYTSMADATIEVMKECQDLTPGETRQIKEEEFVQVECRKVFVGGKVSRSILWSNNFPMILPPEKMVPQTVQFWKDRDSKERPPSVIVIGLDSISRLHYMRSLPKTSTFLQSNGFQEMKGFTNVGPNTFPNALAFVTGLSISSPSLLSCWPSPSSKIDDCPFIWKSFREEGKYVTALVEDSPDFAIFNYLKTGFVQKPVDYYPRPAFLAHSKFYANKKVRTECLAGGLDQTAVLAKYIKSLVAQTTSSGLPLFLLSWFTSAGHGGYNFNGISNYDETFSNLLSDLVTTTTNHNAILIFLSDHGYWHGTSFRYTYQGFFESSLPFLYIRLGKEVREKYPEWQSNLERNGNMLTTPFDLYQTFAQIAALSSGKIYEKGSVEGENGQSLFKFIPGDRTCESASIPVDHCRCGLTQDPPFPFEGNDRGLGTFVVNGINTLISKTNFSDVCNEVTYTEKLYAWEISYGQVEIGGSPNKTIRKYKDILFGIKTFPYDAKFETRLRLFLSEKDEKTFSDVRLLGEIFRINPYEDYGECTKDFIIVNYCPCKRKVRKKGTFESDNDEDDI